MTDQIKYNNKLKDQHVLVIGGTSGIGYGVAEAVLENGGRVTISSSNPSRVESAISRLGKAYPSAATSERIAGHAANLGDEATLEAAVEQLFAATGRVNHVVFTAGDALAIGPLAESSLAQIKQAGMVRFFAPLIVAKVAAGGYLERSAASSITLTTGSASEKPRPGWSVVGGFATGLHGLTRSLALDLKPIRVNLVSPGAVVTEMWSRFPEEQRKAVLETEKRNSATGRVAEPDDIAEAYLYCLKDKNLTGSMISTNGGALIM